MSKDKIRPDENSITPSTLLLNQMLKNNPPANGMLNSQQIELLRKSKQEISQSVRKKLAEIKANTKPTDI